MPQETITILLLASAKFIHIVDFMLIMPLGPQLMQIFKLSAHDFSLLVSSYTFSSGVSGFIGAFWIDRFDRKRTMLIIFALFALSTLGCALATTYSILMFARILTGALGGLINTLCIAIISDLVPGHRRGSAIGLLSTAFSVASVAGVPLSLFIASEFSWHTPFFVLSFLSIPILFLLYLYIPSLRDHLLKQTKITPLQIIQEIFTDKNKILGLSFSSLVMFGHFCMIPFFATYMIQNIGFTAKNITLIYFVGGLFTIFTSPRIGKLTDRYGAQKVFTLVTLISFVPILLVTNLPPIPIALALIATTSFFIFSTARFISSSSLLSTTITLEERGRFMSMNTFVEHFSSGASAMIAGLIVHQNNNGKIDGFPILGLIGILILVISIICSKHLLSKELIPKTPSSY